MLSADARRTSINECTLFKHFLDYPRVKLYESSFTDQNIKKGAWRYGKGKRFGLWDDD
jgi:hypothetical protein